MYDENECTTKIAYDLPITFCVVKSKLIKKEMLQVSFEFLKYFNENLNFRNYLYLEGLLLFFVDRASDGA